MADVRIALGGFGSQAWGEAPWGEGAVTLSATGQVGSVTAAADANVNVTDVIHLINYLFKGGPPPQPISACGDVQCDGNVNVTDAIFMINYLFKGGPPPGC